MMDGKYTPKTGMEIHGFTSAAYNIAANSPVYVNMGDVTVDGRSPLGIQQLSLGDPHLALGNFIFSGTDLYIYVVNPTSTAYNNITISVVLSYLTQ